MGRASTKENKNKYQLIREELGLSREKASELLEIISPERLEKIENERSDPHPDEVLLMSQKYKKPSLCNHYCANQCPIGQQYVPEVQVKELSSIVLEMLASLNAVHKQKDRLIEIAADGKIHLLPLPRQTSPASKDRFCDLPSDYWIILSIPQYNLLAIHSTDSQQPDSISPKPESYVQYLIRNKNHQSAGT